MRIYNSLTRKKDEFVPVEKGRVGMYVCGPTVYDEPHIGHARSAYIFDVVRRYLKYMGFKVKFVRNVTDVDDKIIDKARSILSGGAGSAEAGGAAQAADVETKAREVAEKYLAAYHRDMGLLGIGRPDKEPRATEYIAGMIRFIALLVEKGRAYEADGDVYFDIKKAADYGKLSNQSTEKMEAGARVAPGEKKKDPLDFALWKKAKEGEPSWESPWGPGRPGWHIECSAMSSDILGDEFDIHGGGIDLIFPHHENEIAQSEGAGKKFARVWMHNGLLTINGEKMAKSLGNFITIKDFLARYRDADYLKLLFLNTHYRHPVDYTEEKIEEMKREKERFLILFEKMERVIRGSGVPDGAAAEDPGTKEILAKFGEAMDDDFNTPLALARLFDLVTYANKLMHGREEFSGEDTGRLSRIRQILLELSGIFGLKISEEAAAEGLDLRQITRMIGQRDEARAGRDFTKADEIREKLSRMGVILEDTKDGTVWRKKI